MYYRERKVIERRERPGTWTITYYIGRRRHRKSYRKVDCRTKAEVRRRLREELTAPQPVPQGALLTDMVKEFGEVHVNAVRESTMRSYNLHLRRLGKAFGDLPVGSLQLADLEVWIAAYEETGVSPASVNQAIRTLRRFWSWSVERGDVPRNVAKGLRLRRVPERTGMVLTEQEIPRFLEHCTDSFRPIATVVLFAGLRLGEVINLRWSAVDVERGYLEVRNEGDFISKSGRHRTIPLHPQLKQTLEALEKKSEFVFCTEDGKQRAPQTSWFRTSVQQAAARTGIERRLNFHSLRHTFATRLLLFTPDVEAARQLLGHADVQTTRLYLHPTTQLQVAVERLPSIPCG